VELFAQNSNVVFLETEVNPTLMRRQASKIKASFESKSSPISNCLPPNHIRKKNLAKYVKHFRFKKTHGLKWQNIVAPDGIIINQWGPYEGRRSDPWIQGESNIVGTIVGRFRFPVDSPESIALHTPQNPNSPNLFRPGPPPFIQYCVFGDKGYFTHHTGAVIGAYRRAAGVPDLPPAEQAFNVAMSKGRIAVEWGFLDVVQTWGYLDCTKGMMVWKTPVAHYYQAASLLTNFHCCLYGNPVNE
jgi:hypothetical protein